MTDELETKQQVREFYDRIGWQLGDEGLYQNARYEDLRPVSSEYIHRCHLRVGRNLNPRGRYLLDAGSGPVQYQEYLSYSQGYNYRVCVDVSIQALKEARKRIGVHGLFVVADVTHLPFSDGIFDGEVSLHTLHHLPLEDQPRAYIELYRTLAPDRSAVVVNGWSRSPLMARTEWLITFMEKAWRFYSRIRGKNKTQEVNTNAGAGQNEIPPTTPVGTYVKKMDAAGLKDQLQGQMPFEIRVWRSVNVHFLRAVIHPILGGRLWLRVIYWLEERFPHHMGENGQYPLVVITKPAVVVENE